MRIFRELKSEDPDSSIVEHDSRIRTNLTPVRRIIAFGSARGGVGKSTIAVNVAAALALAGRKVALFDADLNSPSIAAMLGIKPGRRAFVGEDIEPGAGPLGLRLISSEFLPEGEPPPLNFVDIEENAQAEQNGAHCNELGFLATMRRLLGLSRFGRLDLALIDLPPGLEQIYRLLKLIPRAGMVLISHSSDLSARSMRSAIVLVAQQSGSMLGVVENMAGFNCDNCHTVRPLMPYGPVGTLAREMSAQLLERLPFDPRLAESCDRGVIFIRDYPQTPLAKQIVSLAHAIDKAAETVLDTSSGDWV
jgi:ATP-binding protein involved in chromosome partitioning